MEAERVEPCAQRHLERHRAETAGRYPGRARRPAGPDLDWVRPERGVAAAEARHAAPRDAALTPKASRCCRPERGPLRRANQGQAPAPAGPPLLPDAESAGVPEQVGVRAQPEPPVEPRQPARPERERRAVAEEEERARRERRPSSSPSSRRSAPARHRASSPCWARAAQWREAVRIPPSPAPRPARGWDRCAARPRAGLP